MTNFPDSLINPQFFSFTGANPFELLLSEITRHTSQSSPNDCNLYIYPGQIIENFPYCSLYQNARLEFSGSSLLIYSKKSSPGSINIPSKKEDEKYYFSIDGTIKPIKMEEYPNRMREELQNSFGLIGPVLYTDNGQTSLQRYYPGPLTMANTAKNTFSTFADVCDCVPWLNLG